MDVDLRKLRYFVAVAEELNFGRAAERLHVAQPALSRQIAALERELGVVLLIRSKRGTQVSSAGRALLDDARDLLGWAGALQRRARVTGRGKTQLTIGFMPGVLVAAVVSKLSAEMPNIEVALVRTDWNDQLDVVGDGRVDASIVRLPVPTSDLRVIPLYPEARVVAVAIANPLARREEIRLADLVALDLLQPPDFHPDWRDAVKKVRPAALTDEARSSLPAVHTVEEKLEHVAADRGMILLPESAAQFYHRPDVVYRTVDGLDPVVTALAIDPARRSPALDVLVRLVTTEGEALLGGHGR